MSTSSTQIGFFDPGEGSLKTAKRGIRHGTVVNHRSIAERAPPIAISMDKGSRLCSVHRDDARIPKSPPRRAGNAGRNRQLLARVKEHLARTLNDKRRSPVEHEAERLPPSPLVPLQPGRKNRKREEREGELLCRWLCALCTDTSSRSSGCLEMRIPRALPVSRLPPRVR